LPLLYRDVFVFDDAWDAGAWSTALTTGANLKHPSSRHVVAKYANYMFNNSQYHFNSVGEFSLNMSAGHFHRSKTSAVTAVGGGTHSVLLWPDRVLFRGLSDAHIPAVAKAALNTDALTPAAAIRAALPSSCSVPFPDMVVVSACSGSVGFSLQRAQQSLDWFRDSALEAGKSAPVLVLAEDLKNHRTGTNLLVLPRGSGTAEPSEDAFELQLSISKEKVRDLVSKL